MVEVLFFAGLKEQVGRDRLNVEAAGMTVAEMKKKCLSDLNLINLNQAMTAINEEYADEDTKLENGDVIAFIPPVSGG